MTNIDPRNIIHLSRCPRCGGPPQVMGSSCMPRYRVYCLACGHATGVFTKRDSAIENWESQNITK